MMKLATIGFLSGNAGALVGLGGAFVMVPLMMELTHLRQQEANATSLVAVAMTGFVAAIGYLTRGKVDLACASVLVPCASVACWFGARTTAKVKASTLKRWFGFFLIFAAVMVPIRQLLMSSFSSRAASSMVTLDPIEIFSAVKSMGPSVMLPLMIAGCCAGFASGFLGIGSGTIMVPTLLIAAGLTQQHAQGTALLSMVVPAVIGSWTHFSLGNVQLTILPYLLTGAAIGAFTGARIACLLPETIVKFVFCLVLGWTGLKYTGVLP